MKYLLFFFAAGCGQENVIITKGGSTTTQSSNDNSSTVTIDLQGFYDAVCVEDPLTWACAKWCVKHPDKSEWCDVYDGYCSTDEGKADVEFCLWWSENKPTMKE